MKMKKLRNSILSALFAMGVCVGGFGQTIASAETLSEFKSNLQAEKASVEQTKEEIKQSTDTNRSLWKELGNAQEELHKLSKNQLSKNRNNADALDALAMRLDEIERQLRTQSQTQTLLKDEIEDLYHPPTLSLDDPFAYRAHDASNDRLVNPGPQGDVSYTQDAKNAQNNSTMVFAYAPDQLYKIYCRTGYLTDIELKKGERISFIGGGDTSSWAVNTTTVAGSPHIYVKPIVESSTTNLIITTNKRSYQIILNTSNWYNPMVKWSYDLDEQESMLQQNAKDAETIDASMNVASYDSLHFGYDVSVKGSKRYKPDMIFDDGTKTIIQFTKGTDRLPALFIKEPGKKDLSLANFKTKGNCYLIDRIIERAELRYSDTDIVTIRRKK